ncbi:MAG: 50S ribosomal protein L3 [candidate division WOR-3 bacterium]|nr:50S ribosomal protein L3 [candidate division WOR-3 bacterium]
MKGLIGRKVGMTRIYDENGTSVPVTLISAGPCTVTDKKTQGKHKYSAIQLGYEKQKESRVNKPLAGQFKKAGIESARILREIRLESDNEAEEYNIGDTIDVSVFEEGSIVDITGMSKGKGFAGVMKRWGFKGGPASHGAHKIHRKPGSAGPGTDPARVLPGKKSPGHMGHETHTTRNLKIVKIDKDNNIIAVKGPVPGHKKALLLIRQK